MRKCDFCPNWPHPPLPLSTEINQLTETDKEELNCNCNWKQTETDWKTETDKIKITVTETDKKSVTELSMVSTS